MKKGLILVVVLLCVASLMAAMAYSTAVVNNPATMTVENTNRSLLALNVVGGVGNKDNNVWIDDQGRLNFDFSMGNGCHESGWKPTQWGLQRNSTYTWNKMFKVTNHSQDSVLYRIDCDLPYIDVVAVEAAGAGINVPFVENGANNNNALGLVPNDTGVIKVSFTIPKDLAGNIKQVFDGTMVVRSKAVENANRHNPVPWQ